MTIFTTTSPEIVKPCVCRLSSAAVSFSVTFSAIPQKLSNFAVFPLLMPRSRHNAGSAFFYNAVKELLYSACF